MSSKNKNMSSNMSSEEQILEELKKTFPWANYRQIREIEAYMFGIKIGTKEKTQQATIERIEKAFEEIKYNAYLTKRIKVIFDKLKKEK